MIYADNAATTALDREAFEDMKPYLTESYGNASQPYSFARRAKQALISARETVARCIGAQPEEIFFTSGGTESDNWVIKGTLAYGDQRGILTSQIEHHAVLNACAAVERFGYPVSYLPVNSEGILLADTLRDAISYQTKLVSVMLANNEIGTVEPIKELAAIARQHGALFHTDAVQAVGHIPIDVKMLGVDFLSASAHKFNGPKGIGFLYVRKGTCIYPWADGGMQEYGMRAGTENVAAIVGMATALNKNCAHIAPTNNKLYEIEKNFLHALKDARIDFIRNGAADHLPGNINISIKNSSGEVLLHRLDLKGICVSTGSACDSVNTRISHVLRAINVPEEYAAGTLRISFGRDNDVDEALTIAKAIANILNR